MITYIGRKAAEKFEKAVIGCSFVKGREKQEKSKGGVYSSLWIGKRLCEKYT